MGSKRTSLIIQGSILASAGLISKVIGFFYRLQISNILGEQGNGIYSVAFGIYSIALTLSSYSLPAALSKIFSLYLAKGEPQNHRRAFQLAMLFAVISGGVSCLFLFFGASYLETVYARNGLSVCLRMLAPATFIVAILGGLRGYFQGDGTMLPTALSQILEQVINAVVSIIAASQFMLIFSSSQNKFAYGAAGSCLGTLMGAVFALIVLLLFYVAKRKKEQRVSGECLTQSYRQIGKILIITVVPIMISQTVFQLGTTMDDLLFGKLLKAKYLESGYISSMQGVYNSQFNLLINLPVSIAVAMGTAMIPAITLLKGKNITRKLQFVVKINMIVAIPSAVGLAVFAKPINLLLFPRLLEMQELTIRLFQYGSCMVVLLALATLSNSIMHSYNYTKVALIHCMISLIAHGLVTYFLLANTDLEIFAVLISNLVSPLIIMVLNFAFLQRKIEFRVNVFRSICLPFVSAGIMAGAAYPLYRGLMMERHSNTVSVLAAILLAVVVYLLAILITRCVTVDELSRVPVVGKLVRKK